jgi:hypothetical protein
MSRWCSVAPALPAVKLIAAYRWKDSVEARLQRMEGMIDRSAQGSPEQAGRSASQILSLEEDGAMEAQNQVATFSSRASEHFQQPWKVVMDQSGGPGAIPASCLSKDLSSPSESRQGVAIGHLPDIISQGTISLAAAERHFNLYRQHLDSAVYNILAEHDSFASISNSPLLVTVICAVSALHSASPDYEVCYQAFRDEFAAHQISKEHSFHDVRALCIGAFYLSDLSWTLVGAGTSARY